MSNKILATARAIGEKYTCFISDLYKLIESERIEEGTLLNSTNDSFDHYDYHAPKCG